MNSSRVRLPQISSDAFVSPADRTALQNVQKLPLLPVLLQKFNEFAVDRILYARNSAETVRCGPRQFPTLYGLLREACSVLDVPQPELYLRYSGEYNAYTAGVQRTFIVLHSELVDHFTDEELLFVIGHELGHVKCGHVLYQMLARFLIPLLDEIGKATLGVGKLAGIGLVSAFYEWLRQAEFTCDRAGLLVCQDPRVAFGATMKLGCGTTRLTGEMDVDLFLEQARAHSESGGLEGAAKALLFVLYTWQLDHPQVVFRAKGLDEWIGSGKYEGILGGDYLRDAAAPGWTETEPPKVGSQRKRAETGGNDAGPRQATAARPAASEPEPERRRVPRREPEPGDPDWEEPEPFRAPQTLCPKCGALVSPAVIRCRECGTSMDDEEAV